jgi:hypothetical protein
MAAFPPRILLSSLKRLSSGGLTVKSNNTNIMDIKILDKEITIDIQNLDTIKEVISPLTKGSFSFSNGEDQEEKSILDKLKMIKGLAGDLAKEEITISVKDNGKSILVIGEKANPTLSRLILGSNIQTNIIRIVSLVRKLR